MKKEKTVKAHSRKTKSGKTVQVKQHSAKYDSADDMAKKAILAREGAGKELKSKKANVFNKDLLNDLLQSNEASEYHKVWDELEKGMNEERETGKPLSTSEYKNLEKKLKPIKALLDKKYGKGAADYLENNIYDHVTYNKDGSSSLKVKPSKTATSKSGTSTPTISASDFKAWYHWDQAGDPKNASALKVEKCLKKKMGTKAYNKYFDELSDNYTARGHNKAFKGLDLDEGKSTPVNSKATVVNSKQDSGTDRATSDKVINSIVKNYKGASDTVLNRMTKEALAVDGKEDTFSKEWSRTKKLGILKKGLSTSDLTPEDFTALHKKSLRYAKETPKSKPTGMYTKDEFLGEMKSGKIPSLAHRAESKYYVAPNAPTKVELAKYKQTWGEDETYRTMKADYANSKLKKPKSRGKTIGVYPKEEFSKLILKGFIH